MNTVMADIITTVANYCSNYFFFTHIRNIVQCVLLALLTLQSC